MAVTGSIEARERWEQQLSEGLSESASRDNSSQTGQGVEGALEKELRDMNMSTNMDAGVAGRAGGVISQKDVSDCPAEPRVEEPVVRG